jgi:zinc-binding alcohol dehydrogenase/oxidoreductase
MKAAVLEATYTPLRLTDLPEPVARPGEAIVQLKAAALNHRDVWVQKGLYPGMKLPVTPGSDGAGIVHAVGEGVDHTWLGREVILNPSLGWGNNPAHYNPKTFRILGMPEDGTFAEFVRIDAAHLHNKPAHLSWTEAAALPLAGLTAYRALFSRGKLREGDKVLISGVGGGVALFALQFALAHGCDVYVTSGSDEKISRAVALGAKDGISYRLPQWQKELGTKAGLFNVIIDSAAGPGFSKLVDVAGFGGRIVMYGGTLGNLTDIVPAKVFFKQLDIMGTTMGTPEEFHAMLRLVEEKQIRPVIDSVYSLEEIEPALRKMEESRQFGKIVLETGL